MEKRTIIALILMFLIWWISSKYLWKSADQPTVSRPQNTENIGQSSGDRPQSSDDERQVSEDGMQPLETQGIATMFNQAEELKNDIFLENDKIRIYFTNEGGLINGIVLLDFKSINKVKSTREVETTDGIKEEEYYETHITPVNLIPDKKTILQTHINGLEGINGLWFEPEKIGQSVIFTLKNAETDAFFQKKYTLKEDYNLDLTIEGFNLPPIEAYSISMLSGINITEHNKKALKDMAKTYKFVGQVGMENKSVDLSQLSKGSQTFDGKVDWAAIRSKYFVLSLIPKGNNLTQSVKVQKEGETPGFNLNINYGKQQSNINHTYSLYLGPVIYENLLQHNMEYIYDAEMGWRWVRPLGKLFKWYITFLHKGIKNYGIVIIIFALTLKILLTPLTNKSLTSARKMQQIQPLLKEIQAKYKNDIKTQQEELRKLYKEHNVSPLGGCLPLLLQMPIFFALFPVLSHSIEFRQANFVGWLSDLSVPDPYMILPITMGVFMFVQQRMMRPKQDTANMDEKQIAMAQSQKMMSFMMPILMVIIFKNMPAGLVLYWTTFNIFSIIQQYFLNKKMEKSNTV